MLSHLPIILGVFMRIFIIALRVVIHHMRKLLNCIDVFSLLGSIEVESEAEKFILKHDYAWC